MERDPLMSAMVEDPKPVETLVTGQLRTEIYENRKAMGVAAARAMAARLRELLTRQDKVRVVFASAPSQNEFLAELRALPYLEWSRVTAFHMDEYIGLGTDAPQSFSRFLVESLFNYAKPGDFYPLDGLAADPAAECRRYSALLDEAPIDIVCAGIGENGHLAFNDPPVADFDDPKSVKAVDLTLVSRVQQVHDGCFPDLAAVPERALSLTVPALMRARHVFCMVPGSTKAAAVRDTLLGSISTACPATAMRRHPSATLYTDLDSTALLRAARG
jgi:glucosamine-6-phosphate deaminase